MLNLLPTLPGSPGTVGARHAQDALLRHPHIPHDDVVLPEEVQGASAPSVRKPNGDRAGVMARHLETMRNKHAITLEHLRMGPSRHHPRCRRQHHLRPLRRVRHRSKTSIALIWRSTNVRQKGASIPSPSRTTSRRVHDRRALLCARPSSSGADRPQGRSRRPYRELPAGAILRDDVRSGFTFGGITFEEYRGQASDDQRHGAQVHRPARLTPSRWARSTPSAPTWPRRTSTRRSIPSASRSTPSRTAEVRARHRSAHAVQPAADVPSPGRAGQADDVLMVTVADLYAAAGRAGTADPRQDRGALIVEWFPCSPTWTVLDGLACPRLRSLSRRRGGARHRSRTRDRWPDLPCGRGTGDRRRPECQATLTRPITI